MQIVLQSARPPHASLLSELAACTFRQTYAACNDPADMDRHIAGNLSAAHFQLALANPSHRIFLLFADAEAAGFVQMIAPPGDETASGLEIHRIYLLAKFQGQGLGRRLIRQCIETARAGGYHSLWLGVWKENPKAIAFYRRMGFQITGEHIFQLGSDPQEDWIMTLDVQEC